MFSDDTSILVSHKNDEDFIEVLNHVTLCITTWFQVNQLALNIGKTKSCKSHSYQFHILSSKSVYVDQTLVELDNLKFLRLQLDNHLMQKLHINLLLHKLSNACFVIRLSYILGTDAMHSFIN
jgi:hypothetical protein